jgi:hypothetical protein
MAAGAGHRAIAGKAFVEEELVADGGDSRIEFVDCGERLNWLAGELEPGRLGPLASMLRGDPGVTTQYRERDE